MVRRAPLVCQHVENLSRNALEQYEDVIREFVRNRRGVYALYRKDKLYYVGLAVNLRNRLRQHLKDRHGKSWDRFSVYLTIGDSHLKELESLVLRIVPTKGNKQKGKFAKSQNLMPDVRKAFKKRLMDEWGELIGRKTARTKKATCGQNGEVLPLTGRFTRAKTLRAVYKGKQYRARVRKNGTIRYAGKIYHTPSAAGVAVRKKQTDGWSFWKYERAPGEWVRLKELRR